MKMSKLTLLTIVTLAVFSCTPSNNKLSITNSDLNVAAVSNVELDHFEVVRLLKQPDSMDCWATALTILYSWKNNDNNIDIERVVSKYGELYKILFQTNAGITEKDETALYKAAHLSVIQGANPKIETWYDLLKNHGPLSITIAFLSKDTPPRRYIHALVVNGIKGDGTKENTFIDYVDPGDGKQHKISFEKFLKLYEAGTPWPLQIIYW